MHFEFESKSGVNVAEDGVLLEALVITVGEVLGEVLVDDDDKRYAANLESKIRIKIGDVEMNKE